MTSKLTAQEIGRALGRYGGYSGCGGGGAAMHGFSLANTTITDVLEWFRTEV
jgi:hypothetical protein